MRVLFWGSPDFALPSLHAVVEQHLLVGVVTQPDRPAGRGRHLRPSAVKQAAVGLEVPILQPERARGEEFLEALARLEPELSVVVAYGQLLVDEVLALPAYGSINVHASLLPELRGAAPVNWAIIRGLSWTGVTIMRMVREMDAGPVLHQMRVPVGRSATAGELSEQLATLGAEALVEALSRLEGGAVDEREQDHERATFAPKLSRGMARVDWSLPAREIDGWIRGCDPSPAAWSEVNGMPVQLFASTVTGSPGETDGAGAPATAESELPGTVLETAAGGGLVVATGQGVVRVGEVKPAGRSRMTADDWLHGRGVRPGDRFI